MSGRAGMDYFQKMVEDKCSQMRLAALRLYQVESQLKVLRERREAEMNLLERFQEDLQGYTTEMGRAFGLGEGWSVAVDTGKLIPPPKTLDEPDSKGP